MLLSIKWNCRQYWRTTSNFLFLIIICLVLFLFKDKIVCHGLNTCFLFIFGMEHYISCIWAASSYRISWECGIFFSFILGAVLIQHLKQMQRYPFFACFALVNKMLPMWRAVLYLHSAHVISAILFAQSSSKQSCKVLDEKNIGVFSK